MQLIKSTGTLIACFFLFQNLQNRKNDSIKYDKLENLTNIVNKK